MINRSSFILLHYITLSVNTSTKCNACIFLICQYMWGKKLIFMNISFYLKICYDSTYHKKDMTFLLLSYFGFKHYMVKK